jgi:hypothetical protein
MINIESIVNRFKNREVKAREIFDIRELCKEYAYDFVRQHHYLGDAKFFSMYNYGLFIKGTNELVGCATYSLPQGTETLKGWFGLESNDSSVMELTRLCMLPLLNGTNATSFLLSNSVNMLKRHKVKAVITLADSKRHVGSIYQVCNFKYYGLTSPKTDFFAVGFKPNTRFETIRDRDGVWVPRSRKHRYAYILDKKLKCLYDECARPTTDETTKTECCEDTFILYDNRHSKWYTCPRCCSQFINITNEQALEIAVSTNKKEIAEEIIREVTPPQQFVREVVLF